MGPDPAVSSERPLHCANTEVPTSGCCFKGGNILQKLLVNVGQDVWYRRLRPSLCGPWMYCLFVCLSPTLAVVLTVMYVKKKKTQTNANNIRFQKK